jgi:hypothetical protein
LLAPAAEHSVSRTSAMIQVHESDEGAEVPNWMRSTVERLLQSVPEDLLGGLGSIVLTDSISIGRGKTHRVGGRKYDRSDCRGFYHAGTRREVAWIELVTDNMLTGWPKPVFAFQFARDVVVSETLFHEVGHHLHATVGSRGRSDEGAAEDWRRRLTRGHFRKRYWYLRPLAQVTAFLLTVVRRLTSQLSRRASRAAHRERYADGHQSSQRSRALKTDCAVRGRAS